MTTPTKTPAKKRTSRAKPKRIVQTPPAKADSPKVQEYLQDTNQESQNQQASDSSQLDKDLGGAHPDGEAELERLMADDASGQYDDLERPEYADEPEQVGWSAIQSAGLLHMAFAAVAAGRGAHWALQDKEAEMLGESLDVVLDKYFPEGPGKYAPEIALFSSVVMICAPRLALDVKKESEKAEEQADLIQEAYIKEGLHEVPS